MALAKRIAGVEQAEVGRVKPSDRKRLPVLPLVLGFLALVGIILSIGLIFFYAPIDALQGRTYNIIYFHVPISWIGMLAFGVLAVAGIGCLITRDERWDWVARASAEIGAVFITLALITGALWGKPIWGTWWVWDPKLTATLILWFMYIGYLMLRNYMGRTSESANAGAVLAIVGVIDVPIIYLSVLWWRGQHPGQVEGLPPAAVLTLIVSVVTFTLLYSFLMTQVYQLQRLQTLSLRLRALVE
jgi:heme exporter protein C